MVGSRMQELKMDDGLSTSTAGSEAIQVLQRRIRQISVAFAVLATAFVVFFTLLATWSWRQSRALDKTWDDFLYDQFVQYDIESDDYVTATVNAIQFFHNGYSMQFDTIDYTDRGLRLSGSFGNPNQFKIAGLTLNFAVRPSPARVRDQWTASGKRMGWSPEWDIGNALANVGDVPPGGTVPFDVTIAGIKKTSERPRIAVLFSGEHYIYQRER
jgi:hypothetical protein